MLRNRAADDDALRVGKPFRSADVEVPFDLQFARLAGSGRKNGQFRSRVRQHPPSIGRQRVAVSIADAHGARFAGATQIDRALRAAAFARFVEENRLAVVRQIGERGPIEPRHVTIDRLALRLPLQRRAPHSV